MLAAAAAALVIVLCSPAAADAASTSASRPTSYPAWAYGSSRHFDGLRLTPRLALAAAASAPAVQTAVSERSGLQAVALPDTGHHLWRVYYVQDGGPQVEADVSDATAAVVRVWTGAEAGWGFGQGGIAFGNRLDSWYVWLPLCLAFLLPFVDPRRPFRLRHLDLLALLGFSISAFLYKDAHVAASVPLAYPFLLYVLGRMVVVGFRPRKPAGPLLPVFRERWLLVGSAILMVLRIGLNLHDSSQIDVGSAGAIGAYEILHGHQLYGAQLGQLVFHGDTYGPVNYLAYVPFAKLIPSHVQQAAAISFDLLALLAMFLIGRRLRPGREGRSMGLALAYAWASYPFTAFALSSNVNDALVAALVVLSLVVISSPRARGATLALGTMVKLFPVALAPLLATGLGPRRMRDWAWFVAMFIGVSAVCLLPFLPPGGLREIYNLTVGFQLHRPATLSIWGQHPGLVWLQRACEVATVAFALFVAVRPGVRTLTQVASLAAAVIVALEICMGQWFYFYIVWFAPLVFVALFGSHERVTAWRSGRPRGDEEPLRMEVREKLEIQRERQPIVVSGEAAL